MKLQKLLLDYLYEELKQIDVEELFMMVLEKDLVLKSNLFLYVECSYYLQILEDKVDKDILGSFYELVSSDEHQLTKTNMLFIISQVEMINRKSSTNIYI